MFRKLHILIVSDHLSGNVLPVLQDLREGESVAVLCVVTHLSRLQVKASQLEALFRRLHVEVLDRWDLSEEICLYEHYLGDARRLIEKLSCFLSENPSVEVLLNATGGTKTLAWAFQQAVIDSGGKVIYTNLPQNCIERLDLQDISPRRIPLQEDLYDLQTAVELCGYEIQWEDFPVDLFEQQERIPATRQIFKILVSPDQVSTLLTLNGTAQGSGFNTDSFNGLLTFNRTPFGGVEEVLNCCKDAGLVSSGQDLCQYRISKDVARWLGGGWLEEYVYSVARQFVKNPDYIGLNITVLTSNGVANEVDVMLVRKNRLLLLECKTGDWRKKGLARPSVLSWPT